MPWKGPSEREAYPTLGWLYLDWTWTYLPSPEDETKPFHLTDEQAKLALKWFALDPDTGAYVYRRGAWEGAKGIGKSPFAASLALFEFAGPAVPDGWDANGDAVGRLWPNPWVQIAAVSEDQTENTYASCFEFLSANGQKATDDLDIDRGRTRLYLRGKPGRLEPVTASSGSREGQRLTFAVLDEVHLWTKRNGGTRLAKTIGRNAAKMGGRTFETTNAPVLGEKSVAEDTGDEAASGAPGILFVARRPDVEPDPSWSDERLAASLKQTYGDAHWIDTERIVAEIRDPRSSWGDVLRYWFNLRSSGGGHAVDPRVWDALTSPREIATGAAIGIGFDGSISRDATALVGCTTDGYSFLLGLWARPPGATGWMVPRNEVHQAVDEAFARYRVGLMLCDPPKWFSEIEDWTEKWPDRVLALDTNQPRRFAPAVDRWLTGIREGTHTNDGNPLVAEHVKAARLRKVRVNADDDDGRTMYVLTKPDDGRRIDACVADVLAYEAAMTMPTLPSSEPLVIWSSR